MNNYVKGIYKKTIYQSDKGYTIGLIKVKETNDEEVEDDNIKIKSKTFYYDEEKEKSYVVVEV